jgi:isoquinoline 1-oxidoreductase subunit beta
MLGWPAFDPEGPLTTERLSRRTLLIRGAGFAVALSFSARPAPAATKIPRSRLGSPSRPNVWVTISSDGLVTLVSPASEMGQGVMTSIPLLVAEEMDADWSCVHIDQAPSDKTAYGNPGLGGVQATGASLTTRAYYQSLRLAGAQARLVLIASAAALLHASSSELATEPGVVVHKPTGRRLSYGQIARRGVLPTQVRPATTADLKKPRDWRYLGKNQPRVDIPGKVNGKAIFGIDVVLPDMLYGAVARAPVQGESAVDVDDRAARQIPGYVKTVRMPYGVGVIADSTWASLKARDALKVTWSTAARARGYSTREVLADYCRIASSQGGGRVIVTKRGDSAALHATRTVLRQTYTTEHVHHATMEPPCATALVTDDRVQVWGSFQAQTFLQTEAGKLFGAATRPIDIHTTLLGGGFGRKYEADFAIDAVLLARETPGRPVKVTWTREDDMRHGKYRPLEAQFIEVGLDQHGMISAWHHHISAASIMARYAPDLFAEAGGVDTPVTEGTELTYEVPNLLSEYTRSDRGIEVGFWRAIGPGYTKFGIEGMMDEAARAAGIDPLDFRLRHLQRAPRARQVLETAAEMCGWRRRPEAAPLGLAYSDAFGSQCAVAAEIAIDHDHGLVRLVNVWCAIDPGIALQPLNIEAQLMGGIIHGASCCLHEQIDFVRGEVQQDNFHNYRVLRLSETPEIHIRILSSADASPGGIGEAGVPAIGPAIANAFAAATHGRRLRQYPFTPERVRAVLRGRA